MERYELTVPGRQRVLPLVATVVETGARDAGLPAEESRAMAEAVQEAVAAIQRSLADDHDVGLPITVATSFDDHELLVEILERGQPMARGNAGNDPTATGRTHELLANLFDTIHWKQIVPVGSELRLRRRVGGGDVETGTTEPAAPVLADESIPEIEPAPAQDYEFRRFKESDAIHIARSVYQAYGHTYLESDLYDPARITELNRAGRLHSVVAEAADGRVVGHYALERPDPERPVEAGQAVVDHAHRGRHLLEKMREVLVAWARELGLPGFFGRSTARHAATQKMNARFGAIPTGLFLAYSPATMRLRHNPAAGSGDRPSSVLYWTPLRDVGAGPCYIPPALAPTADPILRSLGFTDVRSTDSPAPTAMPRQGGAAIQSQTWLSRGLASLLLHEVSLSSAPALAQCCADLLALDEIFSIVAHLPLDDPHTPWLTEIALGDLGFNLAGVLPFDLSGNRHGLILERTRAEVDVAGLDLESDVARGLLRAASPPRS